MVFGQNQEASDHDHLSRSGLLQHFVRKPNECAQRMSQDSLVAGIDAVRSFSMFTSDRTPPQCARRAITPIINLKLIETHCARHRGLKRSFHAGT